MIVEGELGHILDSFGGSRQSGEDLGDVEAFLHGNDSQLVLFVDPDEESLVVIVENSSSCGPVSVESGILEEPVALLEEEVVRDKLLGVRGAHAVERVIFASEVAFQAAQHAGDSRFDFASLLPGDSGAQSVLRQVPADSDPSGDDFGVIFGRKRGTAELGVVHVADMAVRGLVAMVVLDDLVEVLAHPGVGVVGASVHADSGVDVVDAREYHLAEGDPGAVLLINELVEDLSGEVLTAQGLGAFGELDGPCQLLDCGNVRPCHDGEGSECTLAIEGWDSLNGSENLSAVVSSHFGGAKGFHAQVDGVLTVHEGVRLILGHFGQSGVIEQSWEDSGEDFLLGFELSLIDIVLLNFLLITFDPASNL